MYNLKDASFNKLKDDYQCWMKTKNSRMRRPRNQLTIRQEILAILMINSFNRSYRDFLKAENMATKRTLSKNVVARRFLCTILRNGKPDPTSF